MTDKTIRPLAIALVAEVLLVVALVAWGLAGFPLPAALTGANAHPVPARSAAPAPAGSTTTAAGPLAPRPTTDRFDGRRAFALLREEVERFGWRPAGSPALRRLALRLRALLPNGRFEPIPGHPRERNVVGSIPGRGKAIVLAAHYDVVPQPRGYLGANDGAAGSAAVVWLARALARAPRSSSDRPVRIALFDGEEEPLSCLDPRRFKQCGLRGSTAYAEQHATDVQSLVLLDYIAEKHGLSFPREATSTPALWDELRSAARGARVASLFPDAVGGGVIDDHTPFLDRGIPAIDVIDFDYPPAHTLADTLDKVSERSLDAVGETVFRLMLRLRAES